MHDELLSSWLIRSALRNGYDPMSLTGCLWPEWRPWTIDFDRNISNENLEILAEACKTTVKVLEQRLLKNIAQKVSLNPLEKTTSWMWILTIGARNRLRSGGLQYCPECLKSKDPYFRIQWRLAWHTCCPIHNIILLNFCPHCRMPIEPHRLEAEKLFIWLCPSCNRNITETESIKASENAMIFQTLADIVSNKGFYPFSGSTLTTSHWFELAYFFTGLVKRIAKCEISSLTDFGNQMGFDIDNLPTGSARIEYAKPSDRAAILGCVGVLMRTDKITLTHKLIKAGISQQGLCPKGIKLPKCLSDVILELNFKGITSTPRTLYKDQPIPRPIHEVERRAIRINRKLNFIDP